MPTPAVIRRKIARLRGNQPPRFMDLFAGCGGITLGFATAGFEPVASVESDMWAAESHGVNFAAISRGKNPQGHYKARDVTREDAASIFRDLGIEGPVDEQVDVLVGGPPCQAFARVGRAGLGVPVGDQRVHLPQQQRLLHLERLPLEVVERLHRLVAAAPVRGHLALDDLPRLPRRARGAGALPPGARLGARRGAAHRVLPR